MITETLHIRDNLPNLGGRAAHNMTLQSKSRMGTLEPRTPILHPKTQLRIGHILRQQPDNGCVTALTWTPEGKRERGRPNNLAAHSRKDEVQSRVAVLERGAHCSARQESMESTCGGPMCHLGTRGQVKVIKN